MSAQNGAIVLSIHFFSNRIIGPIPWWWKQPLDFCLNCSGHYCRQIFGTYHLDRVGKTSYHRHIWVYTISNLYLVQQETYHIAYQWLLKCFLNFYDKTIFMKIPDETAHNCSNPGRFITISLSTLCTQFGLGQCLITYS